MKKYFFMLILLLCLSPLVDAGLFSNSLKKIAKENKEVIIKKQLNYEITSDDIIIMTNENKILMASKMDRYKKIIKLAPSYENIFNDFLIESKKLSKKNNKFEKEKSKLIMTKVSAVIKKSELDFGYKFISNTAKMKRFTNIGDLTLLSENKNVVNYSFEKKLTDSITVDGIMRGSCFNNKNFNDLMLEFNRIYDANYPSSQVVKQVVIDFNMVMNAAYGYCRFSDLKNDNTLVICYGVVSLLNKFRHRTIHWFLEDSALNAAVGNMKRLQKL